MKKRNTPKEKKPAVKRERDPIPWRYCFLALFCGLLLAPGFLWAARQHFAAMDYGMKNANLRDEVKSLKDERGRLNDERENARNPSEIKKLMKKFGLEIPATESLAIVSAPQEKPEVETPKSAEKAESNSKVKKDAEPKSEEKIVKDKSGNVKKTESRPQMAKN